MKKLNEFLFKIIWYFLIMKFKTPDGILRKKLGWSSIENEDYYDGKFHYWWDNAFLTCRDLVKNDDCWKEYSESKVKMELVETYISLEEFVKNEMKGVYGLALKYDSYYAI